MKIIQTEYVDEDSGKGYGASSLSILLEARGRRFSLHFGGGDPEDNCLARDLHDAYSISELLEIAYEAGKAGEPLELLQETNSDNG